MARWKYKLVLSDIFHDDDIEVNNKANMISERFFDLVKVEDINQDIVDIFEKLRKVKTEKKFNLVWDDLYDWADQNSLWIETF